MEYLTLRNGQKIPSIGMGTGSMNQAYKHPKYLIKRVLDEFIQRLKGQYKNESNYTVSYELRKLINFKKSIVISNEIGYELYDTAYIYNNCELMAKAFKGRKRESYYIISKGSNYNQRNGTLLEEFNSTLKELNTDYIDLYLLHWPQTGYFVESWKVLEKLYKENKVKAIGVSNFHIHHLEELKINCEIMPMVNELECNPLLQQNDIREYCKKEGIQLIAHTATGKMRSKIRDSVLADIAVAHNKSIAQIILRWHYQLGDVSICNSLNKEHMSENLNIFDFNLLDKEMEEIKGLDCNFRIWPNPDTCDFTKL